MITIKEIARQLNLSTTTVSNVIHGKTGEVSQATIDRVERFVREVDYVPNISARNLATNSSKIIGVVLKSQTYKYVSILMDPFVSELISGIEERLREHGYFMMLYISDDIAEILKHVSTWNVDGLILFYMLDDDGIRVSEKYAKPVVCIDTYCGEGLQHFVNIGLEDAKGMHDVTQYLISMGHRKIGFLSDNNVNVDNARFRGYRTALREAGIEYSDRNFFLLRPERDEIDRSLAQLVEKARDFTAVACVSDLYAVLFMDALRDHGIRVPEDLSVTGFDDNLYARLHRPALTTVHQDVAARGRLAAQTLIDILQGNPPARREIQAKVSLVVRDTVMPVEKIDKTRSE